MARRRMRDKKLKLPHKRKHGVWKPMFGFCKGMANHAWVFDRMRMIRLKSDLLRVTMPCGTCGTIAVDLINDKSGEKIKSRHYDYAPGYIQSKEGKKFSKAEVRKEFIANYAARIKGDKR